MGTPLWIETTNLPQRESKVYNTVVDVFISRIPIVLLGLKDIEDAAL